MQVKTVTSIVLVVFIGIFSNGVESQRGKQAVRDKYINTDVHENMFVLIG